MALDTLAQFDQTVLDLVEHSPVGAVPHTPAYQDALRRLRAAHQVYASADHKSGYVTVRSLAALPAFYAPQLEGFLAGTVDAEALESETSVFNRYVKSLPPAVQAKAEATRAAVVGRRIHHRPKHAGEAVHDPLHALFLVPGSGLHPGLPGNYLYGAVAELENATGGAWAIQVHDVEEGVASCEVATRAEALDRLRDVLASAPFLLSELGELGFEIR